MKIICAFILLGVSAFATDHFIDCQVGTSGNGASWATAWKGIANITGVAAGDNVYFSGSATCSTYTVSQWNPTPGTTSTPVNYRVALTTDTGHTNLVTIALTGLPGMFNTGTGATIQGVNFIGNPGNNTVNMKITGLLGASGSATFWNFVQFEYLDLSNAQIEGGALEHFDLGNSVIHLPANSDHFVTLSTSGGTGASGYTLNRIHDNNISTVQYPGPQNANCSGLDGVGDDGFQWIKNVTFDHNIVYTVYSTSQTVCQHQDFIQTAGSFLDIHSNFFQNPGNYSVYGDLFGSSAHWRIYNNIGVSTNTDPNGPTLQHFALGFESTSGSTLDDVVAANNTCWSAIANKLCVSLGGGSTGNKVTNSFVVNNLEYNTGDELIPGTGGSITTSNELAAPPGVTFTTNPTTGVHTPSTPTGDFHILTGSTGAIGQGKNPAPAYLTGVYTTDKDGLTRANPWDIGAYAFPSGSAQASVASCLPGSGSYGSPQTISCTNPNSGTTVACYTVNGTTPVTNGSGTACTTGTVYTTAIIVSATETLKIIAGTSTLTDSAVVTYNYTITSPPVSPSLMLGPITMLGPVIMQ